MNEVVNKRAFSLVLLRPVILLLSVGIASVASAGGIEQQICDVRADYSLGFEDYPQAIRLHNEVLRNHPDSALAHYHLGFAQGVMGNRTVEVSEYQRAAALGLRNWDLFLNLGLAQLEDGDLDAATDSLRQAVLRGPNHPESHFNLALVFERRGLLADAEREMLASLNLDPEQPDARNLIGVIYAEERETERASLVWRELVHDVPDYQPARENLRLLSNQLELPVARRRPLSSPRRPPSKPLSPPDGRSALMPPDSSSRRGLPSTSHEKPTRRITTDTQSFSQEVCGYDLNGCWHQSCCELLREVRTMGATISNGILDPHGRQCHLRRPIRDHSGRSRFQEMPVILREVFNLDRHMYLVKFSDGATTFVFPDEVDLADLSVLQSPSALKH